MWNRFNPYGYYRDTGITIGRERQLQKLRETGHHAIVGFGRSGKSSLLHRLYSENDKDKKILTADVCVLVVTSESEERKRLRAQIGEKLITKYKLDINPKQEMPELLLNIDGVAGENGKQVLIFCEEMTDFFVYPKNQKILAEVHSSLKNTKLTYAIHAPAWEMISLGDSQFEKNCPPVFLPALDREATYAVLSIVENQEAMKQLYRGVFRKEPLEGEVLMPKVKVAEELKELLYRETGGLPILLHLAMEKLVKDSSYMRKNRTILKLSDYARERKEILGRAYEIVNVWMLHMASKIHHTAILNVLQQEGISKAELTEKTVRTLRELPDKVTKSLHILYELNFLKEKNESVEINGMIVKDVLKSRHS